MVQLQIMIESANESARRFAEMNRLVNIADIIHHRISADAFEEFRKRLCHKLSTDFALEVVQDLLGWVAVPRVPRPFFDLEVIQPEEVFKVLIETKLTKNFSYIDLT